MALRLLVETPAPEEQFEYILEEKNSKEPGRLYIQGPYMMCETVNKNQRIYTRDDMQREVNRYINEMVTTKRAMGELNHPTSAEVNLERACHIVTHLKMENNYVMGKSQVLSTPMGQIVRSLINDGVKVGMSSRALGKLNEESSGVNRVTDMRLVAVDCVADPSCPKAFVNGILESKQFVLKTDGHLEEVYERFESSIKKLPGKDVNLFLKEQIIGFFNFLKVS
ncbi:primosomal protein [bacterium]|nr:primosomal protein [bacterium]